MANLGTFTLKPNIEYQNLATVTGVTFESGKTYQLQITGRAMLCEKETKPENGFNGFRIINDTWSFDCDGTPLWFRDVSETEDFIINIAD